MNLRSILLAVLSIALPTYAFEVFKAEPPALGPATQGPVAVGPAWAAYSGPQPQITVIDTVTRQITHTLSRPEASTPIPGRPGFTRTIGNFGQELTTDGSYLVALSPSTIQQLAPNGSVLQSTSSSTLHAWRMPDAQLIGVVDIDGLTTGAAGNFVGVANGRIVIPRTSQRQILRWDAESLAPLASISIPAGLPAPTEATNFQLVAMSGDDLVYCAQDGLSIHRLFHVNLASGALAELPKAPGFEFRSFRNLAVGAGHLLAPATYFPTGTVATMFHYDLATLQIVARTDFPGGKVAYPFFSPDGSWRAVWLGFDGATSGMCSGSSPAVAGSAVFELPAADWTIGVPFALAQGHLWFVSEAPVPDGTLAYRIPAVVQPVARLTGRCLPANEGDEHLKVVFSLAPTVAHDVVLQVKAVDGSATAGSDFEPFDGEVTIPSGTSEFAWELPLIHDQELEENETLIVEVVAHPADIQISRKEIPGIIGGSSFHRLPPIAAWQGEPHEAPYTMALAGDRIVQTNYSIYNSDLDAPSVVTRPLGGGDWLPSASWGAHLPTAAGVYDVTANAAGLALITNYHSTTLYDPVADSVLYRIETPTGMPRHDVIGDTHFLSRLTNTALEYDLAPPHGSRAAFPGSLVPLFDSAYAGDLLVGSFSGPFGGLRKITQATQTDVGALIPGSSFVPEMMAAEGNLLAMAAAHLAWIFQLDQPARLIPLQTANGPLSRITRIGVAGNRVWVTDSPDGAAPSIRIFEAPSGLETGMLLGEDFSPYLPEGAPPPPGALATNGYRVDGFSTAGKNILAAIRWPAIRSNDMVAARFVQDAGLPGIVDPAPIREDGGSSQLTLTEAAPWPLTVTTRAIAAGDNQAEDWTGSGSTVVIPSGSTSFAPGVLPFNDKLPEGTVAAPLELTISGNGLTQTRRLAVQVEDDDRVLLADVPHTLAGFGKVFAPVAGEWAYRSDTGDANVVAWTGDPSFTHGSPFGVDGRRTFANHMAGTEDWLIVTHDTYGGPNSIAKPSQIHLYQPATRGKTPVRILKGMKYVNRFGQALFARGQTLWVGAPGSQYISPKKSTTAGMVQQYDLPTGKRTRTFKAPKTHAVGFGSTLTANDTSIWIGSPVAGGAVFQYSRDKGKLLRTLVSPVVAPEQTFGTALAATADTVIVHSLYSEPLPPPIRGYAASTGQLQWQLDPPPGQNFGSSFTLIGEQLLAIGGDSLLLYFLPPAGTPEFLVEVLMPGEFDIADLKAGTGQLALRRTQNGGITEAPTVLLDLTQVPKLAPYLPGALAAAQRSAVAGSTPEPAALTLSRTTSGNWKLHLPPGQAATTSVLYSVDLNQWHPIATVAPDGSWQLVPGTPIEGAVLTDGTSLQVPRDLPRLFFRLHTP